MRERQLQRNVENCQPQGDRDEHRNAKYLQNLRARRILLQEPLNELLDLGLRFAERVGEPIDRNEGLGYLVNLREVVDYYHVVGVSLCHYAVPL